MTAKSIDSNPPTARSRDRGPSPFFHGRKEIIDTFNSVLDDYKALWDGTTFLIQGPPGAGKTALLDVLSKHAEKSGWKTAHLVPNALWSPDDLVRRLGKSGRKITGVSAEAGVDRVAYGNLKIDIKTAAHTISDILRGQKKPLLLILDEAQALGLKDVVPPEMKGIVTSVLKEVHNGDLGKPVMLLAGGLGTTEAALGTFGLSRFEGDCTVQLGRLDKGSERTVIRDWLTQAGGAVGDPSRWIDSIAGQAHGWPQHIISYIKPAVKFLASNHGEMTDRGLDLVHEKGSEYRERYYKKRVRDISRKKRQALANIFADVPLGETMDAEDILSALEKKYPPEVAENLFKKALERGIIDEREDGDYGIPIPSFHSWLVNEYAKGKDKAGNQKPKELPPKPKQALLPSPKKDDQPYVLKDNGEDIRKG